MKKLSHFQVSWSQFFYLGMWQLLCHSNQTSMNLLTWRKKWSQRRSWVEFGSCARIWQVFQRLSDRLQECYRTASEESKILWSRCKDRVKSRRDLDTIWSSLGDGTKLGRAVRTGTDLYGPVRILTDQGRARNVQTQQLEEIGSWCKNRARYGQAVRTIDRTCSGSTWNEAVQT